MVGASCAGTGRVMSCRTFWPQLDVMTPCATQSYGRRSKCEALHNAHTYTHFHGWVTKRQPGGAHLCGEGDMTASASPAMTQPEPHLSAKLRAGVANNLTR